MGNDEFTNLVKTKVAQYVNKNFSNNLRKGKLLGKDDIYLPWVTKVLGNNKATASTYLDDGVYFEATYNGNKQELYLDVYKKQKNICIDWS